MIHIALLEPKIPQNTGNVIRISANTGFTLHLIGPIDFRFDDKHLARAGLDYHDLAKVVLHSDYALFSAEMQNHRIWGLTTKGTRYYHQVEFQSEDILLFGSETAGLPQYVRSDLGEQHLLRIPMMPNNRSMNLANTVALASYEAWRQLSFDGAT
jgi:tRNA (cytidine/uridine-2'-O-)-methyltransferase